MSMQNVHAPAEGEGTAPSSAPAQLILWRLCRALRRQIAQQVGPNPPCTLLVPAGLACMRLLGPREAENTR